jgi:hypothetical protein
MCAFYLYGPRSTLAVRVISVSSRGTAPVSILPQGFWVTALKPCAWQFSRPKKATSSPVSPFLATMVADANKDIEVVRSLVQHVGMYSSAGATILKALNLFNLHICPAFPPWLGAAEVPRTASWFATCNQQGSSNPSR